MHALVLAGGSAKPEDPLYAYTHGSPKALIDMGGRSMLERVVGALQSSRHVEEIVIVGVEESAAAARGVHFDRPTHWLPDQGGMVPNLLAGTDYVLARWPKTGPLLSCSADIPTITGSIIDDFIERCSPWDKLVYYNFVTRDVIEKRFPHSHRTYSRLNGLEVAGGDTVIFQAPRAAEHRELMISLTNARKHPTRIAAIVGLPVLVKFLFRRLMFADVEALAARLLGGPVQVVLNDHAEIAMDADKPFQVDQLRAEFVSAA
jgi:molybdopterin-guanine dinucleotide biosynthesis protein A